MTDAPHPFALSADDESALAEAKRISYADVGGLSSGRWRDPFTVPAELFDRVEEVLHRLPTYEPLIDPSGKCYACDDAGRILPDYTKPTVQGHVYRDGSETRPHILFTGRVMLRGEP